MNLNVLTVKIFEEFKNDLSYRMKQGPIEFLKALCFGSVKMFHPVAAAPSQFFKQL